MLTRRKANLINFIVFLSFLDGNVFAITFSGGSLPRGLQL